MFTIEKYVISRTVQPLKKTKNDWKRYVIPVNNHATEDVSVNIDAHLYGKTQ